MNDEEKTKEQLIKELGKMRHRGAEWGRSLIQPEYAEEEILKNEECYRRLVELSPDMIALYSQGKYAYINPAGKRILGTSGPEDLIGQSIFENIHPDYIEIAKERIGELWVGVSQ